MNWDDLRVAMAVHQCGSYAAAARHLRIDETTVARRLERLRKDLDFPLFDVVDGVRRPTDQFAAVLGHVEQIAHHAARISDAKGLAEGPSGRVRIAVTDSVAAAILAPRLGAFLADNPGLCVHLMASTENVDFSRWEADLAIRLHKPEKGDFAISKLGDFDLYFLEPTSPARTDAIPFVSAYPEDLNETPESRHMVDIGLQGAARCLTKNLLVVQTLVQAGDCRAILPDYMCRDLLNTPDLRATKLPITREAWLLVQSHLKHDPAARLAIDWVRSSFASRLL